MRFLLAALFFSGAASAASVQLVVDVPCPDGQTPVVASREPDLIVLKCGSVVMATVNTNSIICDGGKRSTRDAAGNAIYYCFRKAPR